MAPPTNFGKMLEAFEAFSEHFRGRVDRLERRVAVEYVIPIAKGGCCLSRELSVLNKQR